MNWTIEAAEALLRIVRKGSVGDRHLSASITSAQILAEIETFAKTAGETEVSEEAVEAWRADWSHVLCRAYLPGRGVQQCGKLATGVERAGDGFIHGAYCDEHGARIKKPLYFERWGRVGQVQGPIGPGGVRYARPGPLTAATEETHIQSDTTTSGSVAFDPKSADGTDPFGEGDRDR